MISIRYSIRFDSGVERCFTVELDYDTLDIIVPERGEPAEWARLEHEKCPNCSLDPEAHSHCPVAVNLADLIDFFKESKSHEEVDVWIETAERNYSKRVPLQTVASSLMGIYMVTSGCPVLSKMRPMVQTHLPFQNWEEVCYRMVSMYLMAQYFLMKNGKEPDWKLEKLMDFFHEVYKVNNAFFQRLDSIKFEDGDASLNAVSILNASVNLTEMSIESDDMKHWEDLFMRYWDDK